MTSRTKDFSESADEILLQLAKKGDNRALRCIIERYRNSVKITAASHLSSLPSHSAAVLPEFDDLFQEGLLGLMSAIYSFREDRSVSFRTYAAKCISNSIKTAIGNSFRKKHNPPGGIVSFEEIELPSGTSPEDDIIDAENTEYIHSFLNDNLSRLEADVIKLHLSGESYKSISERLGISEKSVDNALSRTRCKLTKFLTENRS